MEIIIPALTPLTKLLSVVSEVMRRKALWNVLLMCDVKDHCFSCLLTGSLQACWSCRQWVVVNFQKLRIPRVPGTGCCHSGLPWAEEWNPDFAQSLNLNGPCVCVCVCVLVAQSCLTLCDPMDWGSLGSSVHGILQARILEWIAMPFSKRSSWQKNQAQAVCIVGRFFTTWVVLGRKEFKWPLGFPDQSQW